MSHTLLALSHLGTPSFGRSDIYARPDVYDMEYEGADNLDARFSLACFRLSARAACWGSRVARAASD